MLRAQYSGALAMLDLARLLTEDSSVGVVGGTDLTMAASSARLSVAWSGLGGGDSGNVGEVPWAGVWPLRAVVSSVALHLGH